MVRHALRDPAHAGGRAGTCRCGRPRHAVAARSGPWTVDGRLRRLGRGGAKGSQGLDWELTKTASKSAIKATSVEGPGQQSSNGSRFFTGSKNVCMKGIGFFFGGLLLEALGFSGALWLMAAIIGGIFLAETGVAAAQRQLGRAKSSKDHALSSSPSRAASICWRLRASSCSVLAKSGSWSDCRSFTLSPPAGRVHRGRRFPRCVDDWLRT